MNMFVKDKHCVIYRSVYWIECIIFHNTDWVRNLQINLNVLYDRDFQMG